MPANARRIVIKIGSATIIGEDNRLRAGWLASVAADIARLKAQGKDVIVVCSGAVGLGREALGYGARRLALEEKQAAAACGQIALVALWARALEAVGLSAAQLLLTADDSIDRRRYLNARNTLQTLLESGRTVPVINENDTVATLELRFGDNDRLAARVAEMSGADLLVLLSDIDGLYTADPRKDASAKHLPRIEAVTPRIQAMAGEAGSAIASGGMATKIEAARIATGAGCHMVIMSGAADSPLARLEDGERHTLFVAPETPLSARKRWIAGGLHPAGSITVDDGAATALRGGGSLLPAGVTAIEGTFGRGDAVLIRNREGAVIGKGLTAYGSEDARRIIGQKTGEIERILGFRGRGALIHRDDLTLQ